VGYDGSGSLLRWFDCRHFTHMLAGFTRCHLIAFHNYCHRTGYPLPEDQIARFIDGRADVKAHGPRDMPVWGKRFYAEDGSKSLVKDRIAKLVRRTSGK